LTELWDHQKISIERARTEPHVALFHEPGLGKTRTAIEILREDFNQHKSIAKTLILCPLSTCKQWKKAFSVYSKIDERKIQALTGPGKTRVRAMANDPKIIITNFESVQIKDFYAELLRWSPEIVIGDESHRLKDSASVRAKKIYPLFHAARRRFILTGTPVLNSLLDIFGQYKALDPTLFGSNFFNFRTSYFYDKNKGMPQHLYFPDWRPLPDASEKIAAVIAKTAVHAKKSECLDLPDLVSVIVPVEMSLDQLKTYHQMEKEFVAELKDVTSIAEFAMTKTLRLQQILAGFVSESSDKEPAWFDGCTRLNALRETLESLGGEQCIIWTNFVPTYAKIADCCEKLGLSYSLLTGLQSISEKEASIASFNSGKTRVIISNPSAGGTGVDGLQVAKYAVYYTRSFNAADYYQSRDRNHRGGSETHFHLTVENSMDEVVCNALLNKQKIGDKLAAWAAIKTLAPSENN
jgi:SNF2 family DNA or RNA helicase